ncbi:MAG: hypothetical protein WKF87_18355 [Chryseolinea sp.]
MGTKQLRISDPKQIKINLLNFVGKKINIVLTNNTAMLGILKEVSETELLFVNMRLKGKRYPISDIAEIYADTIV